jgi:hypothetical protein
MSSTPLPHVYGGGIRKTFLEKLKNKKESFGQQGATTPPTPVVTPIIDAPYA